MIYSMQLMIGKGVVGVQSRTKGMLCLIASAFCFAWMNAFVRLAGDLPFIQKSFFRNLVALLFAVSMLLKEHGSFRPQRIYAIFAGTRNIWNYGDFV